MNARTKSSRMRVVVLSAVAYAVTLAGCQVFQTEPDLEPGAFVSAWKGEKALLRYECIVQKGVRPSLESAGFGSLLLSVAPAVIDKSIEAFSAYLEKKKDALTAVTEYKTAGLLYEEGLDGNPRPSFDCLILVKGKFGPTEILDNSQERSDDCPPTDSTTELWDVCKLRELSLQAPPDFYAEFGVVSANKGTSIAFVPLFVDYTASAADPGKGSKDLLFAITLTAQFKEKSEVQTKTFAAFTLKLSEVRIGSRLDSRNALAHLTTQYQSLPQTSTSSLKEGSFTDMIPIEVLAVVTETEEGGDFYVKAAEVLKEIKKPLSEQATEWLKEVLSSKDQSPSK